MNTSKGVEYLAKHLSETLHKFKLRKAVYKSVHFTTLIALKF